ncbi:MAG: hypothetical protein R3F50_12500 [Gammaproteobacteria bacterium]|jgi:hypothetical protein
MNQDIPWKRFSIEAIVIVFSILLAFAIDAGWQYRLENKTTQSNIEALKADSQRNLSQLDRTINRVERTLQSNISLKNYMLNPETVTQAELIDAFGRFTGITQFYADTKTIDQLVYSGEMGLLNNQIQNAISVFNSRLQLAKDIEQVALDIRHNSVIPAGIIAGWLGTALHLLQFREEDGLKPKYPVDFSSLQDNKEFEQILFLHMVVQSQYLSRFLSLRESLKDLIDTLEDT